MDSDSPDDRHQHRHEGGEYRRIELITGPVRRRSWTADQKAEILAESLRPDRTVAEVARRHHLSRGLLWTWRRQAMVGTPPDVSEASFIPVHIETDPLASVSLLPDQTDVPGAVRPAEADQPAAAGSIEVEIGRSRVRLQGVVDPDALRQVLALIGKAR